MAEHSLAQPLTSGARTAQSFAGGAGAYAHQALKGAVALWFTVAVAGQWMFVYYIAAFYGPSTLSGDFANWDRNRGLTDGYIAGDIAGNAFFLAHVFIAAVLTFGGALQLIPQIRQHAIAFHRWNGRVFLVAAFVGALGGLYLEWVRGTGLRAPTGLSSASAVSLNAVLILACAWLAWRAVRSRDIGAHQRWATRLFLVVNGTWFTRIGLRAWTVLTNGAFDSEGFFAFWSFGAYLFPLAVYEFYLRARSAAAPAKFAMAGTLAVLALITAVGVATTFLRKWLPLLSAP